MLSLKDPDDKEQEGVSSVAKPRADHVPVLQGFWVVKPTGQWGKAYYSQLLSPSLRERGPGVSGKTNHPQKTVNT